MIKTAVVTGASAGIGKACVELLIKCDYRVIGFDVKENSFTLIDDRFIFIKGDISSKSGGEKLIAKAEEIGNVTALINVAGVAPKVRADLLEMNEESYDRVMSINTKGTLFLTQLAAKLMLKNEPVNGIRGSIVNISSCSAYTSSTSRGEYCISKAGVSMITMLFADRLSGEGITVNEVCPGVIRTDMTKTVTEKYDRLIGEGLVPVGRWGEALDVAKAVMALVDGTFGYTTGQSIAVDGGMHIRRL